MPEIWACSECPLLRFPNKQLLERHVRQVHNQRFQEDQCSRGHNDAGNGVFDGNWRAEKRARIDFFRPRTSLYSSEEDEPMSNGNFVSLSRAHTLRRSEVASANPSYPAEEDDLFENAYRTTGSLDRDFYHHYLKMGDYTESM